MSKSIKVYLSQIGKKGGLARTPAKRASSRANGRLGGRPRLKVEMDAYQAMREAIRGADWKTAFMNFTDGFRRRPSKLLVEKDPVSLRPDAKLYALLQSICLQLCREKQIKPRGWLLKKMFLSEPWFVSEMESLRATALLESPVAFRKNNIFVLANFLSRV